MGLGSVSNREGAFGEFRPTAGAGGLQSVGTSNEAIANQVAVPVGETVELTIPGVCLNYGAGLADRAQQLRLVDVNEYSANPRVRRALRGLATYGTSHGVAQAAMWHVCNDLPFEQMAEQTGKLMNYHEIALGGGFVKGGSDSPTASELVDPATLVTHASTSRCVARAHTRHRGKRHSPSSSTAFTSTGLPVQVPNPGASDREMPRPFC